MTTNDVRSLNPRARGWLRHVWDKATTPDDWSSAGEPHEWWDRDSTAPMCAFPRFDLGETAYGLPLMADATPAWREVYTRIAREFCDRHMTFWAALDGLTMVGPDPNADRYPPEWQIFMPERLRGRYPPPGWIGNGIEPWGLAPDPVGADGFLFFRGFFNLLLSVYASVSGDDRYREPFDVAGYQDRTFSWTHQDIARFSSDQLAARPEGPHCENTKIWPFCVSAAGLGLSLFDRTYGTELGRPFDAWTEYAQQHYMGRRRRGGLDWFALYYDPVEREAATFPDHLTAYAALAVVPYVLPQRREWGTWLYEEAVRLLGWSDPRSRINQFLPDPRFAAMARFIAHELGDTTTFDRLDGLAQDHFEPRTFGDDDTRFGYFFGWGEDHPRGQQNALLMMPELGGPGAWDRAFNAPAPTRFAEPTVEGVDFPTLGIAHARNDDEPGQLHVRTYAATPARAGADTTWRVTGLPDPAAVRVTVDGQDHAGWRVAGPDAIEVATTVGDHDVWIRTGHGTGTTAASAARASGAPSAGSVAAPSLRSSPVAAPSAAAIAAVTSCRCC